MADVSTMPRRRHPTLRVVRSRMRGTCPRASRRSFGYAGEEPVGGVEVGARRESRRRCRACRRPRSVAVPTRCERVSGSRLPPRDEGEEVGRGHEPQFDIEIRWQIGCGHRRRDAGRELHVATGRPEHSHGTARRHGAVRGALAVDVDGYETARSRHRASSVAVTSDRGGVAAELVDDRCAARMDGNARNVGAHAVVEEVSGRVGELTRQGRASPRTGRAGPVPSGSPSVSGLHSGSMTD